MIDHSNQSGTDLTDEVNEQNPRWLLLLGVVLLVAVMVVAAFALGVYFGERDLF